MTARLAMWQFQSTLPVWGATETSITCMQSRLFQSTLPVWGATPPAGGRGRIFQSTLPVWGATLLPDNSGQRQCISIHAPRVGSDWTGLTMRKGRRNFNPRSPCGERHQCSFGFDINQEISIHAPRVGSDGTYPVWHQENKISIHAPRVGSDERRGRTLWVLSRFQSTLPVWGATGTV